MSEATVVPTESWQASEEFLSLTNKQRRFIVVFVQTQDTGVATASAYGSHTNQRYRRMLAEKVMASPNVRRCLDLITGRTVKDRFLADLERDLRKQTGVALIKTRELYARVSGLVPSDANLDSIAEPQTFSVGDKVTQRDDAGVTHLGIVKAVDGQGHPTCIEEVQS